MMVRLVCSIMTCATAGCQLRLVPVLADFLRSRLSPVHVMVCSPVDIDEMAIVL